MTTRWEFADVDAGAVQRLADELSIHPMTAKILVKRGIVDPDLARIFLAPELSQLHDPFLLPDMDVAVARLIVAMTDNEAITICGDYDTDGVCSTALLLRFLRQIGARVDHYIPHRERDGYGLQAAAVTQLVARGSTLLVTVDNGTGALEAVAAASAAGLDVIITDHHEVGDALPKALAIVNPKRADAKYPFTGLCGAGVAFKLLMALRQRLRTTGWFATHPEPNLRELLDLVAVATVADVVPLIDENRILVAHGLRQLQRQPKIGLRELLRVAGTPSDRIDSYALGFQLSPRLNAAGRLAHADLALELLATEDTARAAVLAGELNALNAQRQQTEARIIAQIRERIALVPDLHSRSSLVLADVAWPVGVVGIVAGRIAETYRLPAVVIGLPGEVGRGSARTVGNFPLLESIAACRDSLQHFGGHEAAAGLTIAADRVEQFTNDFEVAARARLQPSMREKSLRADAEITVSELSRELTDELQRLGPFGMGNPEPLLVVRGAQVERRRIVGNNHLQLRVRQQQTILPAIGFSMGQHPAIDAAVVDLIGTPTLNTWQGATTVQLRMRDFMAS